MQATKARGILEIKLHSFLISILNSTESVALGSDRFMSVSIEWGRWVGPHGRSEHREEKKYLLPLPGNWAVLVGFKFHGLVTITTELPGLIPCSINSTKRK